MLIKITFWLIFKILFSDRDNAFFNVKASQKQNLEIAKGLFDKAAEYWRQAIKLAPNNYIEAQNWLRTTGRLAYDI